MDMWTCVYMSIYVQQMWGSQKSTLGVLSCPFAGLASQWCPRVLPAIGSASGLLESQVFMLEKQALHRLRHFFQSPQIPAQVQESGSESSYTSFVTNWHKQMLVSYVVGGTFLYTIGMVFG